MPIKHSLGFLSPVGDHPVQRPLDTTLARRARGIQRDTHASRATQPRFVSTAQAGIRLWARMHRRAVHPFPAVGIGTVSSRSRPARRHISRTGTPRTGGRTSAIAGLKACIAHWNTRRCQTKSKGPIPRNSGPALGCILAASFNRIVQDRNLGPKRQPLRPCGFALVTQASWQACRWQCRLRRLPQHRLGSERSCAHFRPTFILRSRRPSTASRSTRFPRLNASTSRYVCKSC